MDLDALLQARFGFPAFRPGQREIVAHVAEGGDALVVMPTGAGKSLCYQVPALARGGTALVVSPLIALMKDQVDALVEKRVRATFINSSLSTAEYRARMDALRRGEVEVLYVAPERFSPQFIDTLRAVDIRLLAIDEAHCLSQWGHDFRPDYLRLGKVREALGKPPTLALTATATPEVQRDITQTLGLGGGRTFIRGFDRENLLCEVVEVNGPTAKDPLLADLVGAGPCIVYVATRKNGERATKALRDAGVRAGLYHGGLLPDERTRIQNDFMGGKIPVVVATNAFGMGIDKRDIRTIVHYDMPGTIEAYYQEIGRAGRDGRMSRAVLLYAPIDRRVHEFFIDNAHPPAEWVHRLWRWLQARGENPVFASVEEMSEALPADGGDKGASACLSALIREGMVRRIAPSDRAASLTIADRPPPSAPTGLRGRVWDLIDARQIPSGETVQFSPESWCAELGLDRDQLHAALSGLADRGYLQFRASERVGGVEILRPGEELKLDESRMKERRSREYSKLDRMEAYVAGGCRRRYIVEHFGEKAPFDACGTCDRCRDGVPDQDVPRPLDPSQENVVLKLLSCVARMERHVGKPGFGVDLIAKTALGSREEKIERFGFTQLTTWGVLAPKATAEGRAVHWTSGEIADVLQALVAAQALTEAYQTRTINGKQVTYKELAIAPIGWQLLKRELADFRMVFPHAQRLQRARPAARSGGGSTSGPAVGGELLSNLRDVRARLAEKYAVPAYVVAPNKTLEDMARLRPTTKHAMLTVHGMGEGRFGRYGAPFLDAIRKYNDGVR